MEDGKEELLLALKGALTRLEKARQVKDASPEWVWLCKTVVFNRYLECRAAGYMDAALALILGEDLPTAPN